MTTGMSCFVAAVVHDVDHPGYSNAYMVNSYDELGTYGDGDD